MSIFRARHQGCAAALHYTLGPIAHRSTIVERDRNRETFLFLDENGQCPEIERRFFAGEYAVSDARSLTESLFAIKRSIAVAFNSGGKWQNEEA
jgi:hypothetical protein